MIMSIIWTMILFASILCAALLGQGTELAAGLLSGAQAGVTLAISITGAVCLWSGVGELMTVLGITEKLSRLLRPLLFRLFPDTRQDAALAGDLSANICANLLGLGNAATPMGVSAAKRMCRGDVATDQLCRLVVLNTASIQLIPTNVAALRSSLGCGAPFDLLPAVWVTSFCSAGAGLLAARFFETVWKD